MKTVLLAASIVALGLTGARVLADAQDVQVLVQPRRPDRCRSKSLR
jgi:hypothetical protein